MDAAREKALGNACFGEKKFAEAIGHYGAALRAPGLAPRDPGRGKVLTSENASLERRAFFHFRERVV